MSVHFSIYCFVGISANQSRKPTSITFFVDNSIQNTPVPSPTSGLFVASLASEGCFSFFLTNSTVHRI